MREALDVILADQVPEWLVGRLPPELAADLPPGVTFAEMIALRLVWAATTADRPSLILAAAQAIIAAQAKPDAMATREASGPPKLEATEERRRAVAEQLGVSVESSQQAESTDGVH